MVAAHHFIERVAERGEEVGDGVDDRAIEAELDQGLGPVQRVMDGLEIRFGSKAGDSFVPSPTYGFMCPLLKAEVNLP